LPSAVIEEIMFESQRGKTEMPLTNFIESFNDSKSTIYRAKSSSGERFVVGVSHKAMETFGEAGVQQKASEKYDAGETAGRTVVVGTYDFA
jgi:hypothetical protein